MAKLSTRLEAGRKTLARFAARKAFEGYMRRGHWPAGPDRLVDAASDNRKFLDLCAGLSVKALSDGKATTHYTWRTQGDDKVRHAHGALNGQVFSWSAPPEGGHPGTAHNCRCWAEPYYGNPAVPDSLLQLARDRQVLSGPGQRIASIETLTRPDGSIAASTIDMVDGTSIRSVFQGSSVSQLVSFPDGASYQSLRFGTAREVSVRQDGETRLRVAQLRVFAPLAPPPLIVPPLPATGREDVLRLTAASGGPVGVMMQAAIELYNAAVATPAPMGLGAGGLPVVAVRVWTGGTDANDVVSLRQDALTPEQVAQVCTALPDVQSWTNEAATANLPARASMDPAEWGNLVHWAIYRNVVGLKAVLPVALANIFPEITIDQQRRDSTDLPGPRYGEKGASRLDILEKVSSATYCVYDVKTGTSGLSQKRILDILEKLPKGVLVYIMEVRPFE